MSVHVIELNDRKVILRNEGGVLVESPGYANTASKQPLFGEQARQIARLHPRQTYTQFWSQLSLDPLANSSSFRHQADLAFAHLNDIAGQHDLNNGVVFAVPSNYNRNQLSILLGLVQSCSFNATGLVDIPLLAAANADAPDQMVYLDIQLHQSVLTSFTLSNDRVERGKVVQIPGTGLLALHDAWANMVTDEFIKQSRFDPQHNAETEQYVYNQLEDWINRALKDNEILMEINNKGAVYQARINQGHFEQRVRNIYAKIRTELDNLAGAAFDLHVPAAFASLPGLGLYLKNITAVQDALLLESCLKHLDQIRGEPGSLNFITSLPVTGKTNPANRPAANSNLASHVLLRHRAYALPTTIAYGSGSTSGPCLKTTDTNGTLSLTLADKGIMVSAQGNGELLINGSPASTGTILNAGDALSIKGAGDELRMIQVE